MSNQNQIENNEQNEIDNHIEMGEALERLKANKDFQKVVMKGYLEREVLNSVSLLSVPQISEQGKRSGVMEDLISASNLQYYFGMIKNFYEGATNPVLSDDEMTAMEAEGEA